MSRNAIPNANTSIALVVNSWHCLRLRLPSVFNKSSGPVTWLHKHNTEGRLFPRAAVCQECPQQNIHCTVRILYAQGWFEGCCHCLWPAEGNNCWVAWLLPEHMETHPEVATNPCFAKLFSVPCTHIHRIQATSSAIHGPSSSLSVLTPPGPYANPDMSQLSYSPPQLPQLSYFPPNLLPHSNSYVYYSRQQNHLHVWEFWIVHSICIFI